MSRLRQAEHSVVTRLHALGTPLTATLDLTAILNEALDSAMELQGADFGSIRLYDDVTEMLTIVVHRGLGQSFLNRFETVDASEATIPGAALRSGARVLIEDISTHPDYRQYQDIAATTGYRGVQSTPLLDRTVRPVGMLSTFFREPYRPSARELRLTDLYARQVADVIASRLAEQRLRDSEGLLSAILKQAPGAVGLFDHDGKVLFRGGPLAELWGDIIPSREPEATHRWRGFDAKGGQLPRSHYPGARALRGEVVTPGTDFIHVDGHGEETWIRVSAAPFRNDAAEITGAVAILQNVDEEKHAEQRLRESEAKLQAAVDLVKLGLYAWDPQTNDLQWDDALRAMWGLSKDSPVDYDVWRAGIHAEDLPCIEAAVQRSTDPQGDGVYDVEYRVTGANDGVERWIATRGLMHFENHRAVSFHGIALDITDQKRVERLLERRVQARTQELEDVNRQLRAQIEQRKSAEAAVQQLYRLDAIGQITSGVAHDFNNLLSVVLTNTRLMLRKPRDPDDQEGLELVHAAAERGAKLTGQLLAFSRKQRLEPQFVDLNSKVEAMSDLLVTTLGGTMQLRTILNLHLWTALVDPTQIELILLNLAINARDAMHSGGTLTIETFNATIADEPVQPGDPSPGHFVGLAVIDTGAGIADDVLPRVFEPFFTTKTPGKGSGLGLAQVFGFAKQSGGGVHIETRINRGTSVKIYLPRARLPAEHREDAITGVAHTPQRPRVLGMLVVDDDKAVLKSTVRMLESLGYMAFPAESGDEALRLIASELPIQLVLADVAMPNLNGIETARAIFATRPDLPVILATGYGDLAAIQELGEGLVLQKPYTESDLLNKIAEALR